MYKIKKNYSGKVRLKLIAEDFEFTNMEAMVEFGLIKVGHKYGKNYIVLTNPIPVPKFNIFFASKIKSTSDKYLGVAIKRLLYLNPNKEMIKPITSYIVTHFSITEEEESEVSTGKTIDVPVLTYEEVFPIVNAMFNSGIGDYVPDTTEYVFFAFDNVFTKSEKLNIRLEVRAKKAREYMHKAIHTAAEYLIESDDMYKITNRRLQSTELIVKSNSKLASIRSIAKYMQPNTERIIDEYNRYVPFSSRVGLEKFKSYQELQKDHSIEYICSKLGISRSTELKYRKLEQSEFIN